MSELVGCMVLLTKEYPIISSRVGVCQDAGGCEVQVEALCASAHEAAKLLKEAEALRSSADEGIVLRGKVTELSAVEAESATTKRLLQGELAQAISDLAVARDELQVCKADLSRVQTQVCYCSSVFTLALNRRIPTH